MKRVRRDLTSLPVFGSELADCDHCELQPRCDRGKVVTSYRPTSFNGLMVIGEGPGQQEVIRKRPFVGPAGRLLDTLLTSVGLTLDECYIANATLCEPGAHSTSLMKDFPNAVPACFKRLEAEIDAVKPTVVLTLGAAAWSAISGEDELVIRHVSNECTKCNENRKVGPVVQCSNQLPDPATNGTSAKACGHVEWLEGLSPADLANVEQLEAIRQSPCPACGAKRSRLRPKMIPCLTCGGKKRREEEHAVFKTKYSLTAIAGGIFEPAAGDTMEQAFELNPWYRGAGIRYVVPTFHPSYILRGQEFAAKTVQKHLHKVRRLLEGKAPISVKHFVTNDAKTLREWLYPKGDPRGDNAAVDIETVAQEVTEDGDVDVLDARKVYNVTAITCIGISFDGKEACVVDTRTVDPTNEADPLLAVLYDFLTDARIGKTYHHGAGYDILAIDRVWGIPWAEQVPSYKDDTLCAHGNLYPDIGHKLGPITFESVDARAWKPSREVKGVEVHGSFEELAEYNGRDVCHTALVRDALGVRNGRTLPGARMARANLERVYEIDSRIRRIAVGMTMNGMPLNLEVFQEAGNTARTLVTEAEAKFREGLREINYPDADAFNPNSSPQLNKLLYGPQSFFKMPIIKATKTGGSTDKETLVRLLATTQDETILKVLNALLQLNTHNYVLRNFVDSAGMRPWEDDRVHPVWRPWVPVTGRWSSSPNAQNWPIWLRKSVQAPPGRKIVGVDADQLEIRVMAFLSGDPALIKSCLTADENRKLEPAHDPHSFVADLAFGARYSSLLLKDPAHVISTKAEKCKCQTCRRKALRDITKRVIYGLNYGAGDQTVLEAIYNGGYEGPPITLDIIAHVRKTVYRVFPGIPRWREEQVALARTTGELRSPLHRRRRIFPLNGDFGCSVPVTETYNYPIQSLGADLMNEAIVMFDDRLADIDPTAFILAQVHDAVYVETAEDKAEAVCELLTDCMTSEHVNGDVRMLFSASGGVSDTWIVD